MEGVIKSINSKKGYGFIESQGKDYFVHNWDVEENLKLKKGDVVSFKVDQAPKDFKAINVTKKKRK